MANYYTQYSFEIENITPEEREWVNERLAWDIDVEDYPVYPTCRFEDEAGDSCSLWIHDDTGGGELDALAEMLQEFLVKFRPDQYITFSWADTCSKPRIDSFGGGAVFITNDDIRWMNTYDWMAVIAQGREVERNRQL